MQLKSLIKPYKNKNTLPDCFIDSMYHEDDTHNVLRSKKEYQTIENEIKTNMIPFNSKEGAAIDWAMNVQKFQVRLL